MRYQIYPKLTDERLEDIELFDILAIDWSKFRFRDGFRIHKVSQAEALKTWLISFNEYGTVEFEDILFLINNIDNPLEIKPELELKIPEESEIQSFILENRR